MSTDCDAFYLSPEGKLHYVMYVNFHAFYIIPEGKLSYIFFLKPEGKLDYLITISKHFSLHLRER